MAVAPQRAADVDKAPLKRSFATTVLFFLLFTAWVGEWPIELDGILFYGMWRSPFGELGPMFVPLPGIRLFPWQVLLVLMVPFCMAGRGLPQQPARELRLAMLISVACVALTVLWGAVKGGSLYFAYYQVWRFLAALLMAYLLMLAMRSPRDLVTLGKLVVVCALIRGTLVIYFYWVHVKGKVYPTLEHMTNHDDSLLFVMAIFITTSWALISGGKFAWMAAALVSIYLFYAMVLNDRRIAWVELVLGFAAIYLLIGPGPLRKQVNGALVAAIPVLFVFVLISSSLGGSDRVGPLQALMSVKSGDDASSLTRQEELRNLLATLAVNGNPLFGTGWGRPYELFERIWSNYREEWVLVPYTPHNSLVGLAVFSGLVGVLGIWGVVPVAAFLAASGYRSASDPIPRAAALVAVGTFVAFSVHCYGDIGLQSFACCVMFGAAVGTAGFVASWNAASSTVPQGGAGHARALRTPHAAAVAPRVAGPAKHAVSRQRRP